MKVILYFCVLATIVIACNAADCVGNGYTTSGFCASKWTTGLDEPRGILVLSNNDVLVVERGKQQIALLYETTKVNYVELASASGLNHGIAYGGGYLYASSASTVYRWPYTVGTRTKLGSPQTYISGIPSKGHSTRTLVYDNGTLIVSVGSDANLDTSSQPGIFRFPISDTPIVFDSTAKTVVATGVRNEVGLSLDPSGRLWGVENGVDDLKRTDLGGDIHNQNPGEEMNLFDQPGKFYGYPYCWSVYNLTAVSVPKLTQYAQPDYMNTYSDAWCQNTSNVVPPKYVMRAHTAPLDILFYTGSKLPGMNGDAFVASHGSWNRNPAAGYNVLHVKFTDGQPVSETIILAYQGPGETGSGWLRPVGLAWYGCGGNDCLLVTDDTTGLIVSLAYDTNCKCNTAPASSYSSKTMVVWELFFLALLVLSVLSL